MLVKKSRYRDALSFEPLSDGSEVFSGLRSRRIGIATGVIQHEVQASDRLDQLARNYYNDDRLWWRIVDANPEFVFGGDMILDRMEGQVILIPKARD